MASPAYVSQTASKAFTHLSATCAPNLPPSIVSGNLLLAFAYFTQDNAQTITASSGWTMGDTANVSGTLNGTAGWAWRKADGADVACTFTCSAASSDWAEGMCFQYSGQDATTPIGATAKGQPSGASTTIGCTGFNTSSNDVTVLAILLTESGITIGNPTGYTSRHEDHNDPDDRTSDQAFATAGTGTGNIAVTISSKQNVCFMIEIQSAAAPAISGTIAQTVPVPNQAASGIDDFIGSAAQTVPVPIQHAAGGSLPAPGTGRTYSSWVFGP